MPSRGVGDVQKLARGVAGAPHVDVRGAAVDGVDALLDQRRDHMRRRRVEVVAGAVQVDRQQIDAVEAVLLAVRLQLHQQRLLGDTVGRVGFLGIAVPQVVLVKRHRRDAWDRRTRCRCRRTFRGPPGGRLRSSARPSSGCHKKTCRDSRGWRRYRRRGPPGGSQHPAAHRRTAGAQRPFQSDRIPGYAARRSRGNRRAAARRRLWSRESPHPPVTVTRLLLQVLMQLLLAEVCTIHGHPVPLYGCRTSLIHSSSALRSIPAIEAVVQHSARRWCAARAPASGRS